MKISRIFKTIFLLDFIDGLRLALKEIVGAYGIVVMNKEYPNMLVAARNGSPLIIGLSENEKFVSDFVFFCHYNVCIDYCNVNENN